MTAGVAGPRPALPALPDDVYGESMFDLMFGSLVGQAPSVMLEISGRRIFTNSIRLMDKTILEYVAAQEICSQFVATIEEGEQMRLGPYFRATDRIETCIGTLNRVLVHLNAINADRNVAGLDRTMRRALLHATESVSKFRNSIEHAESRAREWPLDIEYPLIFLESEQVRFGDSRISYNDLARWITQTFRLIRTLFE